MTELSSDYQRLNEAVRRAGRLTAQLFGQQLEISQKSTSADVQTRADRESEQIIVTAIEAIFPHFNIYAEEQGRTDKSSEFTAIIDPLDGTNNFVLGIPAFTNSVALMRGDQTIYSVVYHPVTDDLFFAQRGVGAFRNGERLAVNRESNHQNITVCYYCDYLADKERVIDFKTALQRADIKRFLDLWSPAFCFSQLAAGRIEAIVVDGIELYDHAAGKLIAREAGAESTDLAGHPLASDLDATFLISNGSAIHEWIIGQIAQPSESKDA